MKMLKIYLMIIIIIFTYGCTQDKKSDKNTENKVNIAVSILPEETFVKAVGGELVNVVTMLPPGASPTNYQPTIRQMQELSSAKLYFSIGVPTEHINIIPKLKDFNKDIDLVNLEKYVEEKYENRSFQEEHEEEHDKEEEEHDHTGTDPHIWMSPKRVVVMIETIRDELVRIDAENKEVYNDNADKYISELLKIDNEIKGMLSSVKKQSFIIFHPSMGYFADDYNLNMVAIEDDGKKATAQSIKNIIDIAKKEDIKFVFYQEEFDDSQAKTIAKEIDGSTIKVAPLDKDYINNLRKIAEEFKNVLK